MNIGLDLDNTICSTEKVIDYYARIFCEENKINDELLWSNIKYKEEFLNKYLEKVYKEAKMKRGAKKVIRILKQKNYKIYIITARRDKYLNNKSSDIILEYFKKRKLVIDGVFIDANDKVEICKEKNIDVMLDDSVYNCKKMLGHGINSVLFDEKNNNDYLFKKVNNWDSFLQLINI